METILGIIGGIILAILVFGAFSNRRSYAWDDKKKNAKNKKANR